MKKLWLPVLLTSLVLVIAGCSGGGGADTAAGKKVYDANCASCHGANGAGGTKVGNVEAGPIGADEMTGDYKSDSKLISRAILEGTNEDGKTLDAAMPRYKGKLSDADVNNVIAYLKTLK